MAKRTAIDSKQGRRAKPEGSPPLLCAFYPRFWGGAPDERQFLSISSGLLGRKHGRQTIYAVFIREYGEDPRTSDTPWQCFGRKAVKLYRKTM